MIDKLDLLSLNIKEINNLFQVKFKLLKAEFLKSGYRYDSGSKFQSKYTNLIDKTVYDIADACFQGSKAASAPVIVALGGYGRKELAPHSDIDIVFIHEHPSNQQTKKFIESLNSHFWNIGMKLSASARTLQDCESGMSKDVMFLTSLLEKRHIWGPKSVYQQLEKLFQQHIEASPQGFFISTKLAERDARHQKMGNNRYQLEPDIKKGKGALRDIHTLLWISNFLYGILRPEDMVKKNILTAPEVVTLKKAQHFIWTARCHLHFLSGHRDDRLSFDSQPCIAKRMGYTDIEPNIRAEKFMKDYFLLAREVGHLTRILCAKIESQSLSGGATSGAKKLVLQNTLEDFPVKGNRLTVNKTNHFRKFLPEIIRIFRVSQTTETDIHPDALRALRNALHKLAPELQRSTEAHHLFLEILLDPKRSEQTLRNMNEADVLGALIPDFKTIVAYMQYDMYHVFTVDEHILRTVGMMHALESCEMKEAAPLATALFPKIHSRRALYAAAFLHDVGKGKGKKKHAETGAKIALKLCPKIGLTPEETETASWLVLQHLSMTMTTLKRDMDDPKTVEDFIALVQSPERLKLLTILTTADIMAVGPNRWNNWKAGLLEDLYYKSAEAMSDVNTITSERCPKPESLTGDDVTYVKITPQPKHDYTDVVIRTHDSKELFATLSGAMAAAGASIVSARIFTQSDGIVLDVFQVQNLNGRVYENTAFLNKTIRAALDGKIDLTAEIRERRKKVPRKENLFKVAKRVIIDNDASSDNTVIEVNGKDRPGLLYDLTSALSHEGLQISAAKITTFGCRAVDVFYVRDSFGLKILHPDRLQTIKNSLKRALDLSMT